MNNEPSLEDPRDREWADFEAYCQYHGIEPTDEDGETNEDAWSDFEEDRYGPDDYDPDPPEPDYEPGSPYLDYMA